MENLCAIRDYLKSPIFQSRRKSRKLHGSYISNRLYCEPPDPMTANEVSINKCSEELRNLFINIIIRGMSKSNLLIGNQKLFHYTVII